MSGTLKHTSAIFPVQPDELEPMVEFGTFARDLGVRRLWLGQSLRLETHLALAAFAARVPGVPLGTSVALTILRHPYQAAVEARSISALSGAPYVAGFGPGATSFQKQFLGEPYAKPLRAMTEYVSVVRRLLDSAQVIHEGEYFTSTSAMLHVPAPAVEVGLGVLRPGMARTVGEIADVAITWLTPHWYIKDQLIPAIAEGARNADRATTPRVASVVHAALARPGRNLRRLAFAAAGPHLGSPHYTDMLKRGGLSVDPRDPIRGAEELIREQVFATGTAEDVAKVVRAHREAGVDEVVINVCGLYFAEGPKAAARDLREILEAVGADD
ncbi:LLM class flavin-dependent oxidoreductase [Streptomyces sp. NPDC005476]|uniref:LLM class flavin-dependent oxidoreductase n=1 Tax=Streptomyces sp. NPDC005476 TaxID=3156882 RepID=UPI0034558834